ncbi:low molecular weight protein-tyrosine-phosphatase [Clostridium sp. AM58-1XD]|uniref:low molecular weight protein-tyrosine-phosphatase n=1 Tax=Clostridium sp. AM58-1XD TaxID=2292307 RepID=UPI000E4C4F04|nr:low molecular weight protein-tyrosine-phosphatase [Clostridium sp. AM58-1XD]RGY99847.1 low molecular weight phosphotyrosine protein phosphatase [Clostridium sp. AM58-1XD]
MTKQFKNNIKILFVCHGNICRSPMAEFVFRDLVEKKGLAERFYVASAATSMEEIGNPVHRGTREKLRRYGISTDGKYAVQLRKSDYQKYDYILGMERWNITNMMKILREDPEGKVKRLLDFSDRPRDIADPWYTGNFDVTYDDIMEGCQALLECITKREGKERG